MITNVPVSFILLILGIAVFVILCVKNVATGVAATAGMLIVALGSTDGILTSIFTTYASGLSEAAGTYGVAFIATGLFAYLMNETRSGESIGNFFVGLLGIERAPFILTIVCVLLQLGGIQTYMFIMANIAFALMKASNMSMRVAYCACIGVPPLITFCMPGSPAMPNVLPTTFLGTTTFAAPLLSFICFVAGCICYFVYLIYYIKKMEKAGIGYEDKGGEGTTYDDVELPAIWKALVPILIILGGTCVLQLVVGWDSMASLAISMVAGSVFLLIVNWNVCYKRIGLVKIFSEGPMSMVPFLMMMGMVMGFANVAQTSACFETIQNAIMNLNVNPYLQCWLFIALIAGLTANGVGAMTMWLGSFAQTYLDMGCNAGALHRICVSTATTFDSLPHSGTVAFSLACFKLEFNEGYPSQFVTTVIIPCIFSLLAVVLAIILY